MLTLAASVGTAAAQSFPIFAGDPVNPATGRAIEALPGTVFFLPQVTGRFNPPIVDLTRRGDVDLVVRARRGFVGPGMPRPPAVAPTGVAGGARVGGGDIPFTVIASDGNAALPTGNPLFGPELNGLPVVVSAFADLDGDGWIGPTDDDPDGALDNGREEQELFVVGRQLAIFTNGVAQGTLAPWKGAPASGGGLRVMLTAIAYVGPFDPTFMMGNVPNGPGVATALPFFPDFDAQRIVEGRGRGGPAFPGVRFGIELTPAFDPPVADPVLGTPFALPTNGSSPTVDRAQAVSGPYSRMHFVRASDVAEFPVPTEVPIHRGADGSLFEDLHGISLLDDGPGNTVTVHLAPVDLFDDITDPPAGTTLLLVASPGIKIVAPDVDRNPRQETIVLGGASGIDVTLDDDGRAGDGPATAVLAVTEGGAPTDTLVVTLIPPGAAGGGVVAGGGVPVGGGGGGGHSGSGSGY